MLQFVVHYGLHFGLPLCIALIVYKSIWLKAYIVMLCAFLIDLDHLLATPIFDAQRCSINFHPLHTYYAVSIYVLLVFPKQTRLIAFGLLAHIIADTADCLLM